MFLPLGFFCFRIPYNDVFFATAFIDDTVRRGNRNIQSCRLEILNPNLNPAVSRQVMSPGRSLFLRPASKEIVGFF